MVRMSDVASRAGVSVATVSHVLNETRYVSPATREKVLQVIEELNYRPDAMARGLRTGSSRAVGFVVPNISQHFFGRIAVEIENRITAKSYSLLVCNTNYDAVKERRYLEMLMERRADGIIIAPVMDPLEVSKLLEQVRIPALFLDRSRGTSSYPAICSKNEEGARRGVSYLVGLGYKRIVMVCHWIRTSSIEERLQGYRKGLEDAGLSLDPCLVVTLPEEPASQEELLLRLLQKETVDVLFAANYQATIEVCQSLHKLGIRFPDDVGLLAFDDSQWAGFFNPPITSIRQPVEAIAERASRLILRLVDGSKTRTRTSLFETELMIRGSCVSQQQSMGDRGEAVRTSEARGA